MCVCVCDEREKNLPSKPRRGLTKLNTRYFCFLTPIMGMLKYTSRYILTYSYCMNIGTYITLTSFFSDRTGVGGDCTGIRKRPNSTTSSLEFCFSLYIKIIVVSPELAWSLNSMWLIMWWDKIIYYSSTVLHISGNESFD